MSSRTKIVVLHLKELLYTGIFLVLGVLFIVLLVIMFLPDNKEKKENAQAQAAYVPGIYTTSIQLGGSTVDRSSSRRESYQFFASQYTG